MELTIRINLPGDQASNAEAVDDALSGIAYELASGYTHGSLSTEHASYGAWNVKP